VAYKVRRSSRCWAPDSSVVMWWWVECAVV